MGRRRDGWCLGAWGTQCRSPQTRHTSQSCATRLKSTSKTGQLPLDRVAGLRGRTARVIPASLRSSERGYESMWSLKLSYCSVANPDAVDARADGSSVGRGHGGRGLLCRGRTAGHHQQEQEGHVSHRLILLARSAGVKRGNRSQPRRSQGQARWARTPRACWIDHYNAGLLT